MTTIESLNQEIIGVFLKDLKSHADDRGFFREIIRKTDNFFDEGGFGQWSHSRMIKNVVKAWHYHHEQTDWWYLPIGHAEVVLYATLCWESVVVPTHGIENGFATHSPESSHGVGVGVGEHMTHVQRAAHRGWWGVDSKNIVPGCRAVEGVHALGVPDANPLWLNVLKRWLVGDSGHRS